jgi:hypothetical protein
MWRRVDIVVETPAHAGSSLADFYTLKMEAMRSSDTSIYTISIRRHIPGYRILHSHRREILKSYNTWDHWVSGLFHHPVFLKLALLLSSSVGVGDTLLGPGQIH